MIEYLHGDEDDEPRGRRLLEELVIVRAHVVCAQLPGDVGPEERGEERSRVDH